MSGASATKNGFAIEAEQSLLGALLISTECFEQTCGILREHHFVYEPHILIFRAIEQAYQLYHGVNYQVVLRLVDEGVGTFLKVHAGFTLSSYFAHPAACALHTGASIRKAAKAVILQWARLAILSEAEKMGAAASSPDASVAEIVSTFNQRLDDIMVDVRVSNKRRSRAPIGDAMQSVIQAARDAREHEGGVAGITWGLTELNRLTGGIQRRDLTLVGARPSVGKTTFALSVAVRAANKGHGVLVLSLEMDRDKLGARAASDIAYDSHLQVPYADIIHGKVSDEKLTAIEGATREFDKLPLWIDDQSGITIADIRVKIEATVRAFEEAGSKLDVVVIDHLGLIHASQRYAGNRTNEIGEITGALKSVAREYDLAVVLLSQLNRGLEHRPDKRPQLSDLRDSGAIEQDADTIMFLHREAYYLDREKCASHEAESNRLEKLVDKQFQMEVIIAKQRNGPIKTVKLFADMACAAIRDGARA